MGAVSSPVMPSVLSWAIAEDGRSVQELAEALDVAVDDVEAWVAGDAAPSRGQVTKIAKALRRPRALFFMPSPPAGAALPASFRHPPGVDPSVSPEVRRLGRESRRIQQAVSWARREQPTLSLPRLNSTTTPPNKAAATVRTWLGLDIDQQMSWKSDYDAVRGWREALERRGVLVFALQLGSGEVRGFSVWDDRAPLIVMNGQVSDAPSAGECTRRRAAADLARLGRNLSVHDRGEHARCEIRCVDRPADVAVPLRSTYARIRL